MKRRWSIPLAAGLSALVMASAAAQEGCVPIEPKKWEGTIAYGGGGWVGPNAFEQGGCNWNGAEALNGSDTIVWDVDGYGGVTASITQQSADPLFHPLQGYFLNENCERGGAWGSTEPGTPYTVGIPEGARWIVVIQEYGGVQTTVTMETPGRKCEPVETPKPPKKKKPKKRP
ncbi:MAG TPA: hypothetical protein VHN37_08765 [Actinomycetota bacterium]|nr:hypothetical protein [Actinomycetota bacterium]